MRGLDLYKVLGGLIIVLVLSAITVIPVESLIASAADDNGSVNETGAGSKGNVSVSDMRVVAAKRLIDRVRDRIENILSLAVEYNITIPENMTKLVDEAKTLLDNATRIVEEKPCEAIRLAIRAAHVFRPVAVYVLSSLPESVREELTKNALERLVETRIEAVKRFEEKLGFLEEKNITIPRIVYEKIDQAKELLNQAKGILENNTYNASEIRRIIHQVDKLLAEATIILYKYFGRMWHIFSLMDGAYHRLIMGIVAVTRAVNHTVRLVEENNTATAYNITSRLIQVVDRITEYLNKTLLLLEQRNASENATRLVETLYNTLVEVKSHLEQAKESLEARNTLTALDELKQTLDKLVTTLEENKDLIKGIHHHLDMLKHTSRILAEALEKNIRRMAMRKATELVVFIARIKAKLNWLEKLYENGNITAEEYVNALTHVKTILENILEHLEKTPHLPEKLVEALEELINWIDNQLQSIQEQTQ